jgi:chloramphenicol 3-O phosphotransferase
MWLGDQRFVKKMSRLNQKQHVIFLNGPSSSGKTTLAQALQEKLDVPFLHIGIDKIIAMMPEKLNNWDGDKVEQGFWWSLSTDHEGKQIADIQLGPYAQRISELLKQLVLTMLEHNHNVIVDEVCVVEGSLDEWKNVLQNYNVVYVGVAAPLAVLEQRERMRGNRMLGSARAQNTKVHKKNTYDVNLDVSMRSLHECVQKIERQFERDVWMLGLLQDKRVL